MYPSVMSRTCLESEFGRLAHLVEFFFQCIDLRFGVYPLGLPAESEEAGKETALLFMILGMITTVNVRADSIAMVLQPGSVSLTS